MRGEGVLLSAPEDEPRATDYCVFCGESPQSGAHYWHHSYLDPWHHSYLDPRRLSADQLRAAVVARMLGPERSLKMSDQVDLVVAMLGLPECWWER